MSVSSAPAYKRALKAGLTARPNLESVQVVWSQPVDHQEREIIVLGTVRQTQDWAPFGQLKKDEDYTIELTIVVERAFNDDREQTDERAMELLEEVATFLRADPMLGYVINVASQLVGFDLTSLANSSEGWSQSVIVAHIRVQNRI